MNGNLWRYVNLLGANEITISEESRYTLLSICKEILKYPHDPLCREVRLNSPETMKLLQTIGAIECLLEVGFVEAEDHFLLPHGFSLLKLETLQKLLSSIPVLKISTDTITGKYILLPPGISLKEKNFFKEVVRRFCDVMRYEDLSLQQKAKRLIPIVQLEINAMKRIRELQKNIKLHCSQKEVKSTLSLPKEEIIAQDVFLCELLNWFKCEFFQWLDKPTCPTCSGSCTFKETIYFKHPHVSRVEQYKCNYCEAKVEFPRYCDPEPLLTLRRGRCGEWANVFTLLCRSLGYDARLVCDQTDHVWTEVWSMGDNQWIHIDPCENIMNKPLMYEKGWHKKLTYIIAYSKDEIQDVTWRYTRNQNTVMKRRNLCSEENLLLLIQTLNEHRQMSENYSMSRKQFVNMRRLVELAGMLQVPDMDNSDNDENYAERSSGSYTWKLLRGEISEKTLQEKYIWQIAQEEQIFQLKYFIVKDVYIVSNKRSAFIEKSGWQSGIDTIEGNIFRKVENDWQMIYLARSPNSSRARISWTFEIKNSMFCVSIFKLTAKIASFHGAEVFWEVKGFFSNADKDNIVLSILDCSNFYTDRLKGAEKITVTASLSGGKGNLSWQHAQLFRQSLDSVEDESMVITIELMKRDI